MIERRRVIRPSTRQADSSYKVDIKNRSANDDLCVLITHESNPDFVKRYYFCAQKLQGKNSIHFKWESNDIVWVGIVPDKCNL